MTGSVPGSRHVVVAHRTSLSALNKTMMITGMLRQALDGVKRIDYIQHGYLLLV